MLKPPKEDILGKKGAFYILFIGQGSGFKLSFWSKMFFGTLKFVKNLKFRRNLIFLSHELNFFVKRIFFRSSIILISPARLVYYLPIGSITDV